MFPSIWLTIIVCFFIWLIPTCVGLAKLGGYLDDHYGTVGLISGLFVYCFACVGAFVLLLIIVLPKP
jgi:hypothetical protein